MRRFKKIMAWTGIILLFIIAGLVTTVLARQNLTYERPYPNIRASTDSVVIARGREIIFGAAHCADCHSPYNADSLFKLGQDAPLSGGFIFDLPLGKIYTKNITPDKETGIGRYTDGEVARILRYGVHADGTAVYNFMPFQNMTDEDLTAIISYLRVQKPIRNEIPDHDLNAIGKGVQAFMIKPVGPEGEVAKSVVRDSSAAYGKYLAVNVANCSGCHTHRTMTGGFDGIPFAGGAPMVEKLGTFTPPNLTTDSSSRIFGWSRENFVNRFRMGRLQPGSPMPWPSYARMSDSDLTAIYNYLQTVPPAKTHIEK